MSQDLRQSPNLVSTDVQGTQASQLSQCVRKLLQLVVCRDPGGKLGTQSLRPPPDTRGVGWGDVGPGGSVTTKLSNSGHLAFPPCTASPR